MECGFTGCSRPIKGHGLCGTHHKQMLRGAALVEIIPRRGKPVTICIISGCDRQMDSRKMCTKHAARARSGLDPSKPQRLDKTPEQRFWEKVDKHGGIPGTPYRWTPAMGECWMWRAHRSHAGYGGFRPDGTSIGAHRYSYELSVGPIPPGLQLDHLCRITSCVNPRHLEVVTAAENLRRAREALSKYSAKIEV